MVRCLSIDVAHAIAKLSCMQVRLILVLAPAACILAAIGVDELVRALAGGVALCLPRIRPPRESTGEIRERKSTVFPLVVAVVGVIGTCALLAHFVYHSVHAAREHYSNTGIVLPAARSRHAEQRRYAFDDFREAYEWLRYNTKRSSRVAAWWDYGYTATAMADRTTFADGNTWNYTHIGVIGKAFVSNESASHSILAGLGATHVLVVCGAKTGFQNDDIGKYLWPVRIGKYCIVSLRAFCSTIIVRLLFCSGNCLLGCK